MKSFLEYFDFWVFKMHYLSLWVVILFSCSQVLAVEDSYQYSASGLFSYSDSDNGDRNVYLVGVTRYFEKIAVGKHLRKLANFYERESGVSVSYFKGETELSSGREYDDDNFSISVTRPRFIPDTFYHNVWVKGVLN